MEYSSKIRKVKLRQKLSCNFQKRKYRFYWIWLFAAQLSDFHYIMALNRDKDNPTCHRFCKGHSWKRKFLFCNSSTKGVNWATVLNPFFLGKCSFIDDGDDYSFFWRSPWFIPSFDDLNDLFLLLMISMICSLFWCSRWFIRWKTRLIWLMECEEARWAKLPPR